MAKLSNSKLSFYLALGYVALGTLCIISTAKGSGVGFLIWLFAPVVAIPFAIFFTERNPVLLLIVCQCITTLIVWLGFWMMLIIFRDDSSAPSDAQWN